jgi:hypothetical protein
MVRKKICKTTYTSSAVGDSGRDLPPCDGVTYLRGTVAPATVMATAVGVQSIFKNLYFLFEHGWR